MDTRLLRSFLTVARLESFTEAAHELGYTQPTVTGHIQKLERRLGNRLLDRLTSRVVVTEIGARLIPHAEELLAAEERLQAASRDRTTRPAGTVRLLAPESLCTYRLPAVIRALRLREPGIQIWIGPGGLAACLAAVRRGSADLALTMEPRPPTTELTLEKVGTEPLSLLDHGKQAGTAVSWAGLAVRDALLIEEGCGYTDEVTARLAATGAGPGRRTRFGSVEAVKRCVAVGLGWTVLPAITAASEIASGELGTLDGPGLPECDIHLVTHPRRHHSPALDVVADELRRAWQL
ncbi:LysR family transcriptional regulator [Nocardia grenadensis]|uniref:LysR family transcriptional regulator n=1 Tax=Nocardia grenadensis TaxID=931537 RepID=UPI0007A43E80|nr:LysR family transcriptional regulator [Nocardia grenadensis]